MNVLLKGLKCCVSHNFVSQLQDNGEETPPHAHKDPKWQAIQSQGEKVLLEEKDGDGTKDGSKEGAETTSDDWLTNCPRNRKNLPRGSTRRIMESLSLRLKSLRRV